MPETIIKDYCPKCEVVNFLNMGDMEDLTVYEPDGIECHKCGHKWLLDEDFHKLVGEDDNEFFNYEVGEKSIGD